MKEIIIHQYKDEGNAIEIYRRYREKDQTLILKIRKGQCYIVKLVKG